MPNRVGRGSQEAPNGPALGHPTGPAAKLPALPVQVLGLPARAMSIREPFNLRARPSGSPARAMSMKEEPFNLRARPSGSHARGPVRAVERWGIVPSSPAGFGISMPKRAQGALRVASVHSKGSLQVRQLKYHELCTKHVLASLNGHSVHPYSSDLISLRQHLSSTDWEVSNRVPASENDSL